MARITRYTRAKMDATYPSTTLRGATRIQRIPGRTERFDCTEADGTEDCREESMECRSEAPNDGCVTTVDHC